MRTVAGVEFALTPLAQQYRDRVQAFMDNEVFPAEAIHHQQRQELIAAGKIHQVPAIVEELKAKAKAQGLWNLFLPDSHEPKHGLTNTDYASIAELTGWSPEIAPEVFNCAAPDTGNMEVLHLFGTEAQKKQWLEPLMRGEIRSGFAMTEPAVASSDARNIESSILRDGDEYVINGRKWWTTGAMDPRCKILIFMGKTDPNADTYHQQSMILVPIDTPGVEVVRNLEVYGYVSQHGHAEINFTNVRVPVTNLIDKEGSGFAIAQARLGPGRIHHCMRSIGIAERALKLMVERSMTRSTFGKELARQGVIQEWIAKSRIEIEQARLLTLKAAWMIDTQGAKAARKEIAAIKVVAPNVALTVLDRAIQVHGGAGVSQDTPLAALWAAERTLRIADGPDEVHLRDVARLELKEALTSGR